MMSQKELFEKFPVNFTKIRGSKVLSKARGKEIADLLKEELANDDAHFKFWVKKSRLSADGLPHSRPEGCYLISIQESIARSYYTIVHHISHNYVN